MSILKIYLNAAEIRNVQDYDAPKIDMNERTHNSVKAKGQAGNIRVKYIMTTQKGQSQKKINSGFGNLI